MQLTAKQKMHKAVRDSQWICTMCDRHCDNVKDIVWHTFSEQVGRREIPPFWHCSKCGHVNDHREKT